jgi:hypothetical protein
LPSLSPHEMSAALAVANGALADRSPVPTSELGTKAVTVPTHQIRCLAHRTFFLA